MSETSPEGGFGLYIHWPFCAAKCPYCDFNSHVRRSVDHAAWREALLTELAHMAGLTGRHEVDSIFFGGGTPSLMEPGTVEALIDAVARHWDLRADAEITLEANPTSSEGAVFAGFAQAGVNRVSIGVQSLIDEDLRALGRLHTADEAQRVIGLARRHFPRLSFDLIYARPGQTLAAWDAELRWAIDLAADHLSLYQLTIEPGTAFYDLHARGALVVPDEDAAAALFEATQAVCEEAGLPGYEISNHARPGAESRHNLVYWRYGDYVGVGPGAHGRISVDGQRLATTTLRSPEAWLSAVAERGHGIDALDTIEAAAQGDEMLMMGLRLSEGVNLARFERLRGAPLDGARLKDLQGDGLIELSKGTLTATAKGRRVLNGVVAALLG